MSPAARIPVAECASADEARFTKCSITLLACLQDARSSQRKLTPCTLTPPSGAASSSTASDPGEAFETSQEDEWEPASAPNDARAAAQRAAERRATPTTRRAGSALVLGVSLATITAYSLNGYVFGAIGREAFTSKLFQLFLCHTGSLLLAPLLFVKGPAGARATLAEYRPGTARPRLSLAGNCSILAIFSMVVYYLWFVAASLLPGQILAAIFQTSIAAMYVLSVLFLGERFCWLKAAGVAAAALGSALSSLCPAQRSGDAVQAVDAPAGDVPTVGLLFALVAALSQAVYKVWFKRTFGQASPNFTLMLTVFGGAAHIFPVLPLLVVGHAVGFEDARIYVSVDSPRQAGLICLAILVSSCVNVGSRAVISMRSPVYWAAVQMLAIPLSVGFDFLFSGVAPSAGGLIGYALIAVGFLLLADLLDGASMRAFIGARLGLARAKSA